MAHDELVTWSELQRKIENLSNPIIENINRGEEAYLDIIAYRGAMSVTEMATKLSTVSGATITDAMVNDLLSTVTTFHKFYVLGNNTEAVSADYYFNTLRKFT